MLCLASRLQQVGVKGCRDLTYRHGHVTYASRRPAPASTPALCVRAPQMTIELCSQVALTYSTLGRQILRPIQKRDDVLSL
jgi:hypothetical protein